jgi:hypothetical protein
MSQREIIEFLKENKNKWFDYKELSDALTIGNAALSQNIRQMKAITNFKISKTKFVKENKVGRFRGLKTIVMWQE